MSEEQKQLGRVRLDALDFFGYLHNTFTQVLVVIPTLLLSDLTHITLYPQNATSYHAKIPVDPDAPITQPMLRLLDEERIDRRSLRLDLSRSLLNLQPFFFFSFYYWACDPVWATYDFPEAANWPAKIGEYQINLPDFIVCLMNSTALPEPSDHEFDKETGQMVSFPAGAMLHSMLTNRNRMVLGIGGTCALRCVLDGNRGTMDVEIRCELNRFACAKIRNVFQIPTDQSSLAMNIQYHYDPSKAISTILMLEWQKSRLFLKKDDLPHLVQIGLFQAQNVSRFLLSPATVHSTIEENAIVRVWGANL